MTFEQFIQRSIDYTNLRFQYGNLLFVQEQGVYKIQAVRLAHEVWEKFESRDRASDVVIKHYYEEMEQLEAELAQAKQINEVYQEDMAKDAEKIASQSRCIGVLIGAHRSCSKKIANAMEHLDSFDISRAGMNQLQRSIESAIEALRGVNDT